MQLAEVTLKAGRERGRGEAIEIKGMPHLVQDFAGMWVRTPVTTEATLSWMMYRSNSLFPSTVPENATASMALPVRSGIRICPAWNTHTHTQGGEGTPPARE